jgi:hypothetical protein
MGVRGWRDDKPVLTIVGAAPMSCAFVARRHWPPHPPCGHPLPGGARESQPRPAVFPSPSPHRREVGDPGAPGMAEGQVRGRAVRRPAARLETKAAGMPCSCSIGFSSAQGLAPSEPRGKAARSRRAGTCPPGLVQAACRYPCENIRVTADITRHTPLGGVLSSGVHSRKRSSSVRLNFQSEVA